jgi:hypothetical protein
VSDGSAGAHTSGPAEPFDGELAGCELSADCPMGTYCDLGECYQQCSTKQPCAAGFQCNSRGLCVAHAEDPSDPPLVTTATQEVKARASDLLVPKGQTAATLAFDVDGEEEVRFRAEARAPWLQVPEPRGSFKKELALAVVIDASALPAGKVVGSIVLHTNHGEASVQVTVDPGLSGVYRGQLVYESPRPFGRVPVTVEVQERDGGFVDVRVRDQESPTFPAVDGRAPTFSARLEASGVVGTLYQRITPGKLGGTEHTALSTDLGRALALKLAFSPGGGLSGTFEERWTALLPSDLVATGRISLARVANEQVGPFSVDKTPFLPAPGTIAAPSVSSACSAAVSCPADPSRNEAAVCGQNALKVAATDVTTMQLISPAGDTSNSTAYVDAAARCDSEWNDRQPSATPSKCVYPAMLDCAHAMFTRAFLRGVDDGYAGAMDVVSGRAGVALLLVNEAIARAYRLPYEKPDSAIEVEVLAQLDKAQGYAARTLRASLDPFLLRSMFTMPAQHISRGNFLALRRVAQVLGRTREITEQRLSLLRRTELGTHTQVRDIARAQSLNLLVGAIALAALQDKLSAPRASEWGLLDNVVTSIASQVVGLDEVDALGFARGYVPFVYDAQHASAEKASNLDFLLADADYALARALGAEKEADVVYQSYNETTEQIQTDLEALRRSNNAQLAEICGYKSGTSEPNLDKCGEGNGALGRAIGQYTVALANIDVAASRIEGLHQRVANQVDRLSKIQGIQEELIGFMKVTNQQITALQASLDQVELARGLVNGLSFQSYGAFAVSVFTTGWNASATMYTQDKEEQIRALRDAQQMKALEASKEQSYVDGMAVIKDLLIGEAELQYQMRVEALQAATQFLDIGFLIDKKVALQLDYEAYRDTTLNSLRNNPLLRVLKGAKARAAAILREEALRRVYLAALAFEFETNSSLAGIRDKLLPAMRAEKIEEFLGCIRSSRADYTLSFSSPDVRTDEISLRRDVFGIRVPVTDDVTGEVLSEGEQFRRRFFRASHMGSDGTLAVKFSTSLEPSNGVWSTGLCNDQISKMDLKLVGDRLGDHQATIRLSQGGTAFQRSCEAYRQGAADILRGYQVANPAVAEIQAGVNAYGASPSNEMFGRSVAATDWVLSIPPASQAPRNADLEPEDIDDIVIRVQHSARTLSNGAVTYNPICL